MALPEGLAVLGLPDTCEAFDERRLARTVVAEQRRHLAGRYMEIDVAQRLDSPEAFGDTASFEKPSGVSGSRLDGCGLGGGRSRTREIGPGCSRFDWHGHLREGLAVGVAAMSLLSGDAGSGAVSRKL